MTDLPSGTLTLLFTDLEGSTRLLQQLGDAYAGVLADQRAIQRTAFANWNGREMDTQGDAFFVVFTRAGDALQAAVEAQRALASHPWPPDTVVQVRMGLHTGEPWLGATGYTGMDIHGAARICAAGHGGQVLLSQTSRDLVENSLPAGVTLRDLGEHRLKDLRRPRHLYQLILAGLPAEFPPLKSLNPDRHNLPIQLTSFIGRERDIANVKRLLGTTRLLTLTGVGGTGKTRLALQVAADLVDQHADGVWLAELAALADPALVPRAVAASFGLRDQAGRSSLEILVDTLRPKAILLILDNCEHLIEACAQLVDTILHACPQVQVLATSREGLGIAGEVAWSVPSLSVPGVRQVMDLETVSASEAVRLFVQRAQAAQPELSLTHQNMRAVARVCQRLDGIPLAIELAAARAKVLTVEQIATRLDDRFRLLTGGSRTALERQQTLRATMDWSYQLLSMPERLLLQRLSVFSGGWTLEAAEQVCSGDGLEAEDVLDVLARLVSKSLVVMSSDDGGAPRYHLLETIRQYAREKLLDTSDGEDLRERHLAFYRGLAEATEPKLKTAERLVRTKQLRMEHDNFRAALEWSLADANQERAKQGLCLASALRDFWHYNGYFAEGRGWLDRGLAALRAAPSALTEVRATALASAGWLTLIQGEAGAPAMMEESITLYRQADSADPRKLSRALNQLANLLGLNKVLKDPARARSLIDESETICRALGPADTWYLAEAVFFDGSLAYVARDDVMARARLEESRALYRQSGDVWNVANPNWILGDIAARQGDYLAARSFYEESLRLYRESGDVWGTAAMQDSLGEIDRRLGDYGAASPRSQESLRLWRAMGNKWSIAKNLRTLGLAALHRDDYEGARTLLLESLAPMRESTMAYIAEGYSLDASDYYPFALTLVGFSEVARARGQRVRAARLLRAAESLLKALASVNDNEPNNIETTTVRIEYERLVSAKRGHFQDQALSAAWTDGQLMTWEQALAFASEVDQDA